MKKRMRVSTVCVFCKNNIIAIKAITAIATGLIRDIFCFLRLIVEYVGRIFFKKAENYIMFTTHRLLPQENRYSRHREIKREHPPTCPDDGDGR